jgi:hypothetical protein
LDQAAGQGIRSLPIVGRDGPNAVFAAQDLCMRRASRWNKMGIAGPALVGEEASPTQSKFGGRRE